MTMVTKTELLELIVNGENSGIEFKNDGLKNYNLAKELVAFSNLEGGMILFGVDDDQTISGVTRDDLEEWVMTTCRDKIRPGIIPYFEVVRDVEPGKNVAIVSVPRGVYLHSMWHSNKHYYYIRVGSQSREPTPEELSRLFQQRGAFRAELRPVSGTSLADLDLRRLMDYYGQIRQQDLPEDDDVEGWQTLLVNTEIMADEGVTLSGLLLFGATPNRFLPQAGIDAVAFPGIEKDYTTIEHLKLRGPMVPLYDQKRRILEAGLVDQALEFVRRNTPKKTVLDKDGRRVEMSVYPNEAVREAVVNALIHRDYLLAYTDIELALYQDRLEVISPGKLPNGITPERMRAGTRAARNEILKDVMRDYGYLEHMGLGVPRKIVRGMNEHNQTDPDLEVEDERFCVRLYCKSG